MIKLTNNLMKSKRLRAFSMAILLVVFAYNPIYCQTLTWFDDFNGNSLNRDFWTYDLGDGCEKNICGWGNSELQYYTNQPNNVRVENGNLIIEAHRENYEGKAFTSGRIKTEGRVHFKYGVLEARIKIPDLKNGLWPALWLLGETGNWPANGEIDIAEWGHADAIAAGLTNQRVSGACHWDNNGDYAMYSNHIDYPTELNNDYHVYKLSWDENFIRCYVDGEEYFAIDISKTGSNSLEEFHTPHYLILNLAVGGQFTGIYEAAGITAPIPGPMFIDYIKLYQDENGSVEFGKDKKIEGNFGVFTETTKVSEALIFGANAELHLWNNLTPTVTQAYEGDEAWSFTAGAGNWFGMGVLNEYQYLSNFTEGALNFHFKTTSTATFRIGIESGNGLSSVTFNNNEYGLQRNGEWQSISIPLADFSNLDLGSVKQMFTLSGNAPSSDFNFVVDNIYYSDGPIIQPPLHNIPGLIQAEDYNDMHGVKTQETNDLNGGLNVGWIDKGDWLEYKIRVGSTASYEVYLRAATPNGPDKCLLQVDGSEIGVIHIENTGGWQEWKTFSGNIELVAGEYTLRLFAETDGFNINWIELKPVVTGSVIHFEAEEYIQMNGVQTEQTSDIGGGLNVGWIDAGDWMDYNVYIEKAGTYSTEFRIASKPGNGQLEMLVNGNRATMLTIEKTGGWQNWATLTATSELIAGNQAIRIQAPSGGWNINWFKIHAEGNKSAMDFAMDEQHERFLLYPNPAQNYITIVPDDKDPIKVLEIYSPLGNLVKKVNVPSGNTIYLGDLNPGLYIIREVGGSNKATTFLMN